MKEVLLELSPERQGSRASQDQGVGLQGAWRVLWEKRSPAKGITGRMSNASQQV